MKHLPLIRNDNDLAEALHMLEALIDTDPADGSLECDQIDALTVLIQAYETKHYALPAVNPVEIVRFYMEQNALAPADLGRLLGSRSRASEFLTGKRPLSLGQINKLRAAWGLSADLLIARDSSIEPSSSALDHWDSRTGHYSTP